MVINWLEYTIRSESIIYLATNKIQQRTMMALVPGDLAPDFTLDSVLDGKVDSINLSSMKGKYVVLIF